MKKTLRLLAILVLFTSAFTASASFDVSLKYGSKGDPVVELQDFLADQNLYTGKVDGKFGFGTLKAVKAFQSANDLSVDGYFGKASRAKASDLLAVDLKTSDDAEQAETGTVSTPVVQPQVTTDTATQAKIDALTQQVQVLTQATQQVAKNTTQVVAPAVVTPPAPVIPPYVAPVLTASIDPQYSSPKQVVIPDGTFARIIEKFSLSNTAVGSSCKLKFVTIKIDGGDLSAMGPLEITYETAPIAPMRTNVFPTYDVVLKGGDTPIPLAVAMDYSGSNLKLDSQLSITLADFVCDNTKLDSSITAPIITLVNHL